MKMLEELQNHHGKENLVAGADGDRYITFGFIIPSVPVEEEDDGEEKSVAEKSTQKKPEVICIEDEEEESVTEDGEENNADITRQEEDHFDNDDNWSETEEVSTTKSSEQKVLSKLGGKIAKLYENMEISDVCLSVNGEEIMAHKLILYLHSPCLAAMIKQDEWVSSSTKIDIEGFAPLTVQKALEFMYTETIVDVKKLLVDQMMELSRFATMFSISDLKEFINNQIINSVNTSTACELANLSSMYNEEEIHSTALEYITKNLANVKLDDSFAELSGENAKAILRML
uniref:BTB domain-containing protein n=1 Tax=Panagrolaimus superbus TaxID=310955 RepID=A0A914YXB7_9BILA